MRSHWLTMILFVVCNIQTGQQLSCLDPLKSMVTSLAQAGSDDENLKSLKSMHSTRAAKVMHITEETLAKNFKVVMSFKKNKYLLSKHSADVPFAQYVCGVYGGYIVEINDEEELQAVKNWTRPFNVYGFHIGHNDHLKQGDFKYSFSGTRAFMKIAIRDGGREQTCFVLWKDSNWDMVDVYCSHAAYYICEIPDVN